ncbi:replication-associated recombination protein A [Campylobacter sp. VBCF_05 NA6]|uniref:replication-associated recombination protein A n=1 Tax=unclassified Campylobacter TaxID=2593542 RepID=UPI0022EA0575|nr:MULTISPECIES: replication-associated recombination protein A [unclassified Campylobacter]MDA3057625.1 replication-associated recombination protein A [Campylobacter sp. VBCF_04 NA7]MDA3058526.1 replication-associated recombination protein A [Campylobacter sp. VBCF_05 NA6]
MQSLALKFRPKSLNEILGQKKIVELFKKFIASGKIPHSIFFGAAGCGKTTMARVLASELNYDFYELDATSLKVEDIRKILSAHSGVLAKPLIFIDEIHRLSKTQQEVLLIPMENYEAIIIGATTENPQFVISSGIRSRSMIFEFEPLGAQEMSELFERVQGELGFACDDDAREYLIHTSAGDGRSLLNLLEFAILADSKISLDTLKTLRASAVAQGVSSDDTHYELASAMIKSLRGSEADAALYYVARLIEAGESADFIARRMVILASEDIGNANPNALNMAVNTLLAVSKIGYPEARIILGQCAVYLAHSPKSNSAYNAINEALKFVREGEILPTPRHLINSDKEIANYLYPHDFGGWVEQEYTSAKVKFYHSKQIGFEKTLDEWLKKIKGEI